MNTRMYEGSRFRNERIYIVHTIDDIITQLRVCRYCCNKYADGQPSRRAFGHVS